MKTLLAIILGFVNIVFSALTISSILDNPQYSFMVHYQPEYFIAVFLVVAVIYYILLRFVFKKDPKSVIWGLVVYTVSSVVTLGGSGLFLYLLIRNSQLGPL